MKGSLVVLVVVILFLVGCSQQPYVQQPLPGVPTNVSSQTAQPAPQNQPLRVKDCGVDANCFYSYLTECKPVLGYYQGQTTLRVYEIKGLKSIGVCNVHLTTTSQNVVDEDCTALSSQSLYNGYYKRDLGIFQVDDCTNRIVKEQTPSSVLNPSS